MTSTTIEIDDMPEMTARFVYSAEYDEADPSVGIFKGGWNVTGEIETVTIGSLILSRGELRLMLGEKAVMIIERAEETRIAECKAQEAQDAADDHGDYLFELRRDLEGR